MDHPFGAVDLFPTSYQEDTPIFSPDPFLEQLDRGDFADGITQPDPSNFQFPARAQTPKPNPSMDHSFIDFEQFDVEDLLGDKDDDGAQPAPDTDPAEETAGPMEIAHLEEVAPLEVNGHQRPHPAGDVVGPSTNIGMGRKAPGELGVNSLETDGTGLINQPEPCSGDIDLSTATMREIMDHIFAYNKDREVVPKFDDDLANLEPWKLPVHKQRHWATNMLDLDKKTLDGGCWKEAEFRGIRRYGPYVDGQEMRFMCLMRTLEFHKEDGTETEWRMVESIWISESDGHVLLQNDAVRRYVFKRSPSLRELNYMSSRIVSGDKEDELINRCCISNGDCSHHHHTVQNNQAPSPSGKRPRTEDDPKKTKLNVWQHFTRIYIKVPKEAGSSKNKKDSKKLIYAVCNYCDKVFKADSKQGTSHHGRHAESCRRKHSQPSSSKSCSQDIPLILEAREIVSAGGCGSGMLCV